MSIKITKRTSTTNTTSSPGRKVEYIIEHYAASVTSKAGTALNVADWFANPAAQASADFIVDDVETVQSNPDPRNRYCWAVGGSNYGNKGGSLYGIARNANSISIEICSTNKTGKVTNANDANWYFTDAVLNNAVTLTKQLMKEYGIDAAHVIRHYDVNGKPCPGIIGWNADSGNESKWKAFHARLTASNASKGLQAATLKNLSEADVIAKVGALFTEDQKKTGILACVSFAQFILESGYGKTELAQNANNCFGMKKELSGNSWGGSVWDGVSIYTKKTQEQKTDGTPYWITADFRKYPCVEDSIADHSAYLLGAKNGNKFRYEGLKNCTDYKKAITIIKNGGYATDVNYIAKICDIIERWGLTAYNANMGEILPDTPQPWYRVRTSWADAATQKGAFHDLENAKKCADENAGYYVFDESGNLIYAPKKDTGTKKPENKFEPYTVRVRVSDLRIRKKPTIDAAFVGFTGKGIFTIVEEKDGKISKDGTIGKWGKLLSGAGWICLAFPAYTVKT